MGTGPFLCQCLKENSPADDQSAFAKINGRNSQNQFTNCCLHKNTIL